MIGAIAVSLIAVIAFAMCLGLTGIAGVAHHVMRTTGAGLSAMMNPELDDDAKEVAVRRAGLALVRAAFAILWRFAAALGAAAAAIYAADGAGLAARADVFAVMLRLDYIVIVSGAMILGVVIFRRLRGAASDDAPSSSHYSAADRFFHEVAFSTPAVLKGVSWIEDKTMLRAAPDTVQAPIFVTSLARGGTTALLNALYDVPGMATHIYRDMPFPTAPMLWHRVSGGNRRRVERHQRAHGDGLEIDLDTPEALEEVVWKMCWPEKYRGGGVGLLQTADHSPKAERFLRRHMAKIVCARRIQGRTKGAQNARYFSKNNANIARLGFLRETFPDCKIVVPVRRPECHAASLLRQHRNFLTLHAEDDFVRRYMRDIGHFEFGKIHKPILFPGFSPGRYDNANGDYWMYYWIQAFRHVLTRRDDCIFVLQDDLRAAPQATMSRLCGALDIAPGGLKFDRYFRSEPDVAKAGDFSPGIYDDACDIYDQIKRHALR
ncbi:MAG: sulfotransferase [Sediminimonas qiaohouensis]|uniref:Sulfotransferase n=1 Tax=Sediminimonas qiaohouensis TaxID=552061 RepID=A0A7C9L7Q3_9RHOB|nr:sulfotransferase [Sediminimonas qiaohouensis]MTJ04475.1 sulfotransferase [Sediminimonas qiaohouensis]